VHSDDVSCFTPVKRFISHIYSVRWRVGSDQIESPDIGHSHRRFIGVTCIVYLRTVRRIRLSEKQSEMYPGLWWRILPHDHNLRVPVRDGRRGSGAVISPSRLRKN
jgi:hypothetical protein